MTGYETGLTSHIDINPFITHPAHERLCHTIVAICFEVTSTLYILFYKYNYGIMQLTEEWGGGGG